MSGLKGYWQVEGDLPREAAILAADAVVEAEAQGKSLIVVDGVTLRWVPAPGSLDDAWAEAEAALPEGCALGLYWQVGVWHATYQHKHTECPACGMIHQCEPESEAINWPSTGPTPAAALRALAAKLRERAG